MMTAAFKGVFPKKLLSAKAIDRISEQHLTELDLENEWKIP